MNKKALIPAISMSSLSIIYNLSNPPVGEALFRQQANPTSWLVGMLMGASFLGFVTYKIMNKIFPIKNGDVAN